MNADDDPVESRSSAQWACAIEFSHGGDDRTARGVRRRDPTSVRITRAGMLIAWLGAVMIIFNPFGLGNRGPGAGRARGGPRRARRPGHGGGTGVARGRDRGDPVAADRRGHPRPWAVGWRSWLAWRDPVAATRLPPGEDPRNSVSVRYPADLRGLLLALDRDLELQRQVVGRPTPLDAEQHAGRGRRDPGPPASPARAPVHRRYRQAEVEAEAASAPCRAAGIRCPACRRPSWSRGGW